MKGILSAGLLLFAALPATTNYQLNSYTFGSGGTANSSTATYALEGSTGELNGAKSSTITYSVKPGFIETQQANTPKILTLDNGSGLYYNKLHFVIDQQNNPTDALYALSISTDNFVADTRFVKNDLTVSASLVVSDYKTYAAWGGATGAIISGLNPGTTYYLKVKATQGKFTESGYGPVSSTAVANPSITFSVTTSSQFTPPFSLSLGALTVGSVITSSQTIVLAIDSNAASGVFVYVKGKNGSLISTATPAYTLSSATADLASAASGYGIKSSSIGQTSGGPLTTESIYGGTNDNVGVVDTLTRSLYSAITPIIGGTASLVVKAKAAVNTPIASDYADTLTFVASATF